MSVLLGVVLAAGVLLCLSPWWWPPAERGGPRHSALGDLLVQAGIPRTTPAVFVAVSLVTGVVVGAVLFLAVPVVPLAVAAAPAAASAPLAALVWRARRQRMKTAVVWPDVVDHLVSAVRSGLALPDGLAALATSGPEITRPAFARFAEEYRQTGSFGVSVDAVKAELADPVADRILETLRMAREVGGSELSTVLRELGAYLRQEQAIRAEVEARQSWVVNAARLGVAAPWIVLLLLATRPEAATAYNSAGGVALVVIGAAVSVLAYRVMMRIARLPEQRRWFA